MFLPQIPSNRTASQSFQPEPEYGTESSIGWPKNSRLGCKKVQARSLLTVVRVWEQEHGGCAWVM
jgi:hypothetical protein